MGSALPRQPEHSGSSFEDNSRHHRHEEHHAEAGAHAHITAINSPQELSEFLNQDDRICVIKFHAAWCKSCQRFGLKFQGLANQKTDLIDSNGNVVKEGPMRFGSIEFGANTGLCRSLGIKRLPTVHFYHRGHQLDAFPCGPAKFPMLLDKVQIYLQAGGADSLEEILKQGDDLMSSSDVAGVLQQLMEKDEANGSAKDSKATIPAGGAKAKKWWNKIMP